MAEKQFTQSEPIQTGDDLTCPNCGSHRVWWVPYPKVEFGVGFVLWLIFSFAGYAISPVILLAGLVLWSIALIARIRQNQQAKRYNRMHCDICGTDFDVAKSSIQKGGSST